MKFAVLSSPTSWYVRDLQRAAGADHEIVALPFTQLASHVSGVRDEGTTVHSRKHVASETVPVSDSLHRYDAVIVRSMPGGSLEQIIFRMDALGQYEAGGGIVVNAPRTLEIAIDKYLSVARMQRAGLPVPETIACQTSDQALQAFEQLDGDVVVKPVFGGEGRGLVRVTEPEIASRVFRSLEAVGSLLLLQRFIPHDGTDWRLLVLGDAVLGMSRTNTEDWRTNVALGASTRPLEVTDEMQVMARAAVAAVGGGVCAVDILPATKGGLYVLEVNAVPGWKMLSKTLERDVAREFLDHVAAMVADGR